MSFSFRDTIGVVMAGRRTKKDKIIAALRRQVQHTEPPSEAEYSLPGVSQEVSPPLASSSLPVSAGVSGDFLSLFSYDPAFIRKDLVRTSILTLLAFSTEFVLYFWLR